MIRKLRKLVALNLLNSRGWKTDKKIVVFESDDWGSIRMPSKKTYNFFLNKGIPVDKSCYNKFDSLESESDLKMLFESLSKFKDRNSDPPVFTANTVITNPDFDKIRESNFEEYHYELFTNTYKKYPEHNKCFEILKKGIEEGLFHPQFHGREHVNVRLWLLLLQNADSNYRLAFDHEFWGLSRDVFPEIRKSIQATFDMKSRNEIGFLKQSIEDGLNIFEEIFGFQSRSFIANNFIWDTELNRILSNKGIRYLQGMKYQKLPLFYDEKKRQMIRHYLGEKNKWDQYYLIRNCTFEPSMSEQREKSVDECIMDIKNAFFWKKPAIITTHRLNFMGFLEPSNREKNLKLLEKLLDRILKKWPDVEFWSSDQLGNFIKRDIEK